jgi:cell division protein ZapE
VFLGGVPVMDDKADDAARRFITLVDELYDRGVKLFVAAAVDEPEQLYAGERLTFEFRRAASRLQEMQGRAYLAKPHRP